MATNKLGQSMVGSTVKPGVNQPAKKPAALKGKKIKK